MNCAEIKNLLSPYLEGELDIKKKALLEEHLSICSACAKELEGLKETLASLKKIPAVQPPPYFLDAVHARLEKEPVFGEILRKLFVPFYIKVPMEAIAVTATVIILVVLVRKSEIAKITPIGMPVHTQHESSTRRIGTQEIGSGRPAEESGEVFQEYGFSEIHPREMASQVSGADLQSKSLQQYGLSAAGHVPLTKPDEGIPVLRGSIVQDQAIAEKEYYKSKDMKMETRDASALQYSTDTVSDLKTLALAEKTAIPEKEITLKAQELSRDSSEIEAILEDLGIANIKIEHEPEKVSFSFSILANQLEVLISRLKDWQIVSLPAKDIATKEEAALKPISVKLTLTTQ